MYMLWNKRLVVILIINSEICLWEWVEIFVSSKNRYKHELNRYKTKIEKQKW